MARGGARPGAGRKSKAEEAGVAELIDSAVTPADWRAIFKTVKKKAARGDTNSARFLAEYRFGKPHQSIALEGGSLPVIVKVVYDEEPTPSSSTPAPASGTDDDPPAGEEV